MKVWHPVRGARRFYNNGFSDIAEALSQKVGPRDVEQHLAHPFAQRLLNAVAHLQGQSVSDKADKGG